MSEVYNATVNGRGVGPFNCKWEAAKIKCQILPSRAHKKSEFHTVFQVTLIQREQMDLFFKVTSSVVLIYPNALKVIPSAPYKLDLFCNYPRDIFKSPEQTNFFLCFSSKELRLIIINWRAAKELLKVANLFMPLFIPSLVLEMQNTLQHLRLANE